MRCIAKHTLLLFFLLCNFSLQAETKDLFIKDSDFDQFAKQRLSDFKEAIEKAKKKNSESKFKFKLHDEIDPMDQKTIRYAYFKDKNAEIRIYKSSGRYEISFDFHKQIELEIEELAPGTEYSTHRVIGRYRENEVIQEQRIAERDKQFKNKFTAYYQTMTGPPKAIGINADAMKDKNASTHLYVFVEEDRYILNKDNMWVHEEYFDSYAIKKAMNPDKSILSYTLEEIDKIQEEISKRLKTINGCENFKEHLNQCILQARSKKTASIIYERILPKKVIFDTAYQFNTSRNPIYFEVNPFDKAIQRMIDLDYRETNSGSRLLFGGPSFNYAPWVKFYNPPKD